MYELVYWILWATSLSLSPHDPLLLDPMGERDIYVCVCERERKCAFVCVF